ncbi:MAG: hypothetical protein IJ094_00350 [Bacilli bacterium]|nr:hypothetical protein [Bacilli bacterium]
MKEEIEKLKIRIDKIEQRNKKVENDKAWETSFLRKIIIVVLTYIFALLYLKVADTTNPYLGAIVPCLGFFLSTLTIKFIKNIWINKR